jgi:hypothetical protein
MFGSNWLKGRAARLALFGLLAFAPVMVAIGAAGYGFYQQSEYEREADKRYQEYAAHTYYPKREACLKLPFLSQKDCIAKAESEAREYERGEQDLVAQRVTAIWTSLMGSAAIVGMMLSVLGIFLVWTTFKATKKGNKITRKVGEAQTRAYLSATGGLYRVEPRMIFFQPKFKNSGNSPAKRITTKIWVRLVVPPAPQGPPNTQWESIKFDGTCDDIASNSETVGQATLYSNEAPPEKLQQLLDVKQFYLEGVIEWFDVFEKKQTISFALLAKKAEWNDVGGDRFLLGKLFAVMNRENQAA